MNTSFRFGLGWMAGVVSVSLSCAQGNNAAQPAAPATAADQAWSSVTALARPASNVQPTGGKTLAQAQAEQLQAAASAARNFYLQYPVHAKAAEARKIEALATLQAAGTDAAQEQAALAQAAGFRNNASHPVPDRIEVALVMERIKLLRKLGPMPLAENLAEYEKLLDDLRREFGDRPEVFDAYLGLLRNGDMATAARVAQKLLPLPLSPAMAAEAQAVIQRHGLIGRSLELDLTTADGQRLALAAQSGRITILYVWSAVWMPHALENLRPYQKDLPADTQWIFLSLGTPPDLANIGKTAAPGPGTHCYHPLGMQAPVADFLKVRSLPYVYVINRAGVLSGFGRETDLPALCAAAVR